MLYFIGCLPILESFSRYSDAVKFIYCFSIHTTEKNFKYLQKIYTKYTKTYDDTPNLEQFDPRFTCFETCTKEIWKLDDEYHNNDGPAIINYRTDNKTISSEEFYTFGKLYKKIEHDYNGILQTVCFYQKNRKHNDFGPAVITFKVSPFKILNESWLCNGLFHRRGGGPTFVSYENKNVKCYHHYGEIIHTWGMREYTGTSLLELNKNIKLVHEELKKYHNTHFI